MTLTSYIAGLAIGFVFGLVWRMPGRPTPPKPPKPNPLAAQPRAVTRLTNRERTTEL